MNRPDFRETARLIEKLRAAEAEFLQIFAEAEPQRTRARELCGALMREQAAARLGEISVEELRNARAGIRTSLLAEAGYRTLLDLYLAKDDELAAADGIGEKQIQRVREILDGFLERLAANGGIRLSVSQPEKPVKSSGQPEKPVKSSGQPENPEKVTGQPENPVKVTSQPENPEKVTGQPEKHEESSSGGFEGRESSEFSGGQPQSVDRTVRHHEREQELSRELVTELSRLRRTEQIRRDAETMREEAISFLDETIGSVAIRNRLRWLFSGRRTKEETVRALGSLLVFSCSPQYERMCRFSGLYREAVSIGEQEAQEDFQKNGAAFYALAEKLTGAQAPQELVFRSIPARLAARINAFEPDLSGFRGDLRAYQLFGVRYILTQKRVLLGDEMGLGKTIQAIAAMAHLQMQDPKARFLIVCPASVLINWCREIRKFSRIEAHLLHGPSLDAAFAAWELQGGAAVTNYESMGKLVNRIDNRMRLSLLVIDEAHYIKNPEARRTKHIHALNEESERILMMTGTPLENHVSEMCTLIGFVRPDMEARIRESVGLQRVSDFRQMLAPVYLRRQRDQVLTELPSLTEEEEWCAMSPQDSAAYGEEALKRNFTGMRRVSFLQEDMASSAKGRRLCELCQEAAEEGRKIVVFSYFRETVRKAAALLGERLGGDGGHSSGKISEGSSVDALDAVSAVEAEKETETGRASEGSTVDALDAVSAVEAEKETGRASEGSTDDDLDAVSAVEAEKETETGRDSKGLFLGVITGSTPAGERQKMIDRFSDSAGAAILICQVQAGGTGLNIQAAGAVIFCEPQIKPSLTRQAISRVYRMGQVRSVLVFHLLCENTVDEAVRRILEEKQAEFDLFADESSLAEAEDGLADAEWIRQVVEAERSRYLPAVTGS